MKNLLELLRNIILLTIVIWIVIHIKLHFNHIVHVLNDITEIWLLHMDFFNMINCDSELTYDNNNDLFTDKPSFNYKVDNHDPRHDDTSEHEYTAVGQMNERLRDELLNRHQNALEAEVNPIDYRTLTDEQADELLNRTEPGIPNFPDQPEYVEHPVTRNIVRRETVYTQDPVTGELVRIVDPDRPFDN